MSILGHSGWPSVTKLEPGLAAQKAAALEVSGKPPGGADLNLSIEEAGVGVA
jgi:hypothetical protein